MKMIVMALVGLIVFAGATAGGWYVKKTVLAPPAEETDADQVDLTADPTQESENEGDGSLMPVAVREDAMSVEELLRYSLSLKEREKSLRDSEEQFRQRNVQQQLVLADVQAEQQTIDGLRTQLTTDLGSAQGMIEELNRLRQAVIEEREKSKLEFGEIEAKRIDITEQHKANDKKLSTWLQGMTSEKAAAVLKEMANDGNMKVAVQILANFEEREAAKILDSIDEPKLLNEFIAEFRNLKNARGKDDGAR
jgi:flagellar motility protein MotE (MotC chaperone)